MAELPPQRGQGFLQPQGDSQARWWPRGDVQACPARPAAEPASVTSSDITAGKITCYFPSLDVTFPAITGSYHLGRRKQRRAVRRGGEMVFWAAGACPTPVGCGEVGGGCCIPTAFCWRS